jgi:hypothetical protein
MSNASTPRIGVRQSDDREAIVIVFGDEGDAAYYGRFTPEGAMRIAEQIRSKALSILQLRPEIPN